MLFEQERVKIENVLKTICKWLKLLLGESRAVFHLLPSFFSNSQTFSDAGDVLPWGRHFSSI